MVLGMAAREVGCFVSGSWMIQEPWDHVSPGEDRDAGEARDKNGPSFPTQLFFWQSQHPILLNILC